MKQILAKVLVGLLTLVVVVLSYVGYAVYSRSKLEASARAYVDQSLPLIVDGWSKAELLKRASPQFRESASDDQVEKLFAQLSTLGRLQHYDGAEGNVSLNKTDKVVTAAYGAHATFEHGNVQFTVRLIQNGGQWQILYFHASLPKS